MRALLHPVAECPRHPRQHKPKPAKAIKKDSIMKITLRPTTVDDLETLFTFMQDEEGQRMAAFMPKDAADKAAWVARFTKMLNDETVNNQVILVDGVIVGSVAKFMMFGDAEITYWIDRKWWGKGVASGALQQFVQLEHSRPLFGRTAFDNRGSQRVLEKCGFVRVGSDRGFASALQEEIEEFVHKLESLFA